MSRVGQDVPCPAGCPLSRLARLLLGASPSPQPRGRRIRCRSHPFPLPPPSINNSGWADLSDSPGRADPLTRDACSGKSECKTYRSKNRAAGEPRRQIPALGAAPDPAPISAESSPLLPNSWTLQCPSGDCFSGCQMEAEFMSAVEQIVPGSVFNFSLLFKLAKMKEIRIMV